MYLLRPANTRDLDALFELAGFLDSLNLPADRELLAARLGRAERSFATLGPPTPDAEYQFALEDDAGRVVGTSAVLAKHGTPQMPHVFLRVGKDERYARSVDVQRSHVTFQLGTNMDGPSELGALVLHPDARGQPGSPGKLLAWGRFAFIALHPDSFQRELLAEMRASFDPEGRNAFWEAFGRRFTGMNYDEADRRSAVDKEFMLSLFPRIPFYASLLDDEVAAELGRVHPETLPAVRLLEQAGFHWNGEIDPLDAGPFYAALRGEVLPIRETVGAQLASGSPADGAPRAILSAGLGAEFRAVAARAEIGEGEIRLDPDARARLRVHDGDAIAFTPLPPSRRRS